MLLQKSQLNLLIDCRLNALPGVVVLDLSFFD
jgi:hypothetical protein